MNKPRITPKFRRCKSCPFHPGCEIHIGCCSKRSATMLVEAAQRMQQLVDNITAGEGSMPDWIAETKHLRDLTETAADEMEQYMIEHLLRAKLS